MGPTVRGVETSSYDWSRFSFESFAYFIGRQKNLKILLRPQQLSPNVFGIWFPNRGRHYVCYDDTPPIMWALVNGLHELGHVVLDHTPKDITEILKALRQDVLKDIKRKPGENVLGLCKVIGGYQDDQEKGAENWALEIVMFLQRNKYPLALKPHANKIELLHGTGI